MATLLQEFVDADQWEAEDTIGRLGMVMHAAFLAAGFQPYGATPASGHLLKRTGEAGSRYLSRQYTAPQLTRHEDADAAVLLLCARGDDVALVMFLTSHRHLRHVYRERLHVASTVAPLLSCTLGDTEPWGSRICRRLAGGVCRDLFAELCFRNGLMGLICMPDDVKVEILKRLNNVVDLARVELTCTQLRRLVAERDDELWKPLYNAMEISRKCQLRPRSLLSRSNSKNEDKDIISWKRKYVDASRSHHISCWMCRLWPLSYSFPVPDQENHSSRVDPTEAEETTVVSTSTWDKRTNSRYLHRPKVARNELNKRQHSSGAIHSPSSRYRWKHR